MNWPAITSPNRSKPTVRKMLLVAWTLLVVGGPVLGDDPRTIGVQARNKVEGTWEHTFPNEPALRQVKVINQDHFIWATYDRESKIPVAVAGGSYKLDGNTYTERVEFGRFGTDQLQQIVGKEQTFNVEIVGDTLTLTGTLSNGMELREVWTRVK
jgi:hypothetical protein